jgi:protein-tyrosine phosphatase
MIAVLYVCHANMCRSPALQGFLQKWVDYYQKTSCYYIDSCGLGPGQSLDSKTFESAKKKGVHLSHKPRALEPSDFVVFDYILAATYEIQETLISINPESQKNIYLATHFSKVYKDLDLPDPYNLGLKGFDNLMEMVEDSTYTFFNYLEGLRG